MQNSLIKNMVLTFVLLSLISGIASAEKILMNNGNVISGTIQKFTHQYAYVQTDYAGTIKINRKKIKKIYWKRSRFHMDNQDIITGRILERNEKTITIKTEHADEITLKKANIKKEEKLSPPRLVSQMAHEREEEETDATRTQITQTRSRSKHARKQREPSDAAEPDRSNKTSGQTRKNTGKKPTSDNRDNNDKTISIADVTEQWDGSLNLGFSRSTGNTDSEEIYLRLDGEYDHRPLQDEIRLELLRSSAEGTRMRDLLELENHLTGYVRDRTYAYNHNLIGSNDVVGMDFYFEEGVGLGYDYIDEKDTTLQFEGGLTYRFEERSPGDETDDFYLRFAEGLEHRLDDKISVSQDFELLSKAFGIGPFIARLDMNLQYDLSEDTHLKFIFRDRFNSDPPDGIEENDMKFISTFGFDF